MKPKTFYAYVLRDPRCTTPFYVGKGTGRRAHLHLEGGGHSSLVARKVNKLRREGVEPSVEIIEALDEDHAFFLESCLIEVLGRRNLKTGPLLNLTNGGEGMSGYVQSAETRAKRASKLIGRYCSEETRKKMSASLKNPSEQTRAKQSAAKKGVSLSKEHCAKLSESKKGRAVSAEHREKLSIANSGKVPSDLCREMALAANLGRSFSKEHREKLSAARKGKLRGPQSEETKAKIRAAKRRVI